MTEAEFSGFGAFSMSVFLLPFRTQVQFLTAEVTIIIKIIIVYLNQFSLPAKRERRQRPAHITCILLSFGRKFGHTGKERNIALQKVPNLKNQESRIRGHRTGH